MVAARHLSLDDHEPDIDQRVFLYDVSWAQYLNLLRSRGESAVPRMTYLEGTLELMSPSRAHEVTKTTIARLIEAWAFAHDIPLVGLGSLTMRRAKKKSGLEPDECYYVGARRERPQLAIEVVYTSGGLDKLDVYRGLDIGEVWVWRERQIEVHVLADGAYERAPKSLLLPAVNLKRLARYAEREDQHQAIKAFIRKPESKPATRAARPAKPRKDPARPVKPPKDPARPAKPRKDPARSSRR